jgi:hypothetical protein
MFAIVITVPLGAMCINTLGMRWLDHDGEILEEVELSVLQDLAKIAPAANGPEKTEDDVK